MGMVAEALIAVHHRLLLPGALLFLRPRGRLPPRLRRLRVHYAAGGTWTARTWVAYGEMASAGRVPAHSPRTSTCAQLRLRPGRGRRLPPGLQPAHRRLRRRGRGRNRHRLGQPLRRAGRPLDPGRFALGAYGSAAGVRGSSGLQRGQHGTARGQSGVARDGPATSTPTATATSTRRTPAAAGASAAATAMAARPSGRSRKPAWSDEGQARNYGNVQSARANQFRASRPAGGGRRRRAG